MELFDIDIVSFRSAGISEQVALAEIALPHGASCTKLAAIVLPLYLEAITAKLDPSIQRHGDHNWELVSAADGIDGVSFLQFGPRIKFGDVGTLSMIVRRQSS